MKTLTLKDIPSLGSVLTQMCRNSFADFFRYGWHVLEEDTPLAWNWHIDAVCDHLQAAFEDWLVARDARSFVQRITRLLINIPPGTAKSRIVSVYFLAWIWLKRPTFKAIFLSSSQFLVLRDSDYCRDIIKSAWYQSWFAPDWQIRGDSDGKAYFRNTAGGWRRAVAFGARLTGERGDMIAWDDPHDATEVESDAKRFTVLEQWDKKIGNRVNDAERSLRIGVMQRLHEEDLSGHVLKQGGWEHLCIPMEFDRVCDCESCQKGRTVIGWVDPRTEQGELLFGERFSQKVLADELVRLGSYGYAGQMQQRPVPAGGGIFQEKWFRYWQYPGQNLPPVQIKDESGKIIEIFPVDFDPESQGLESGHSWDMAFKDSAGSDFVAGLAAKKRDADTFLIHSVNERMDFVKTLDAVPKLIATYPSLLVLIEDKANGPAVINVLKNKVPGLVAVEPEGGKKARAHAVAPVVEAGNVYLPHPRNAPWVRVWLAQVTAFPGAAKDDMVDAFTQLLARWYAKLHRKKSAWGVA